MIEEVNLIGLAWRALERGDRICVHPRVASEDRTSGAV
jgi:hypothetical protein